MGTVGIPHLLILFFVTILPLALAVAALVTVGKVGRVLTPLATVLWVLLVIFVPFIGALAWFFAGYPPARRESRP